MLLDSVFAVIVVFMIVSIGYNRRASTSYRVWSSRNSFRFFSEVFIWVTAELITYFFNL